MIDETQSFTLSNDGSQWYWSILILVDDGQSCPIMLNDGSSWSIMVDLSIKYANICNNYAYVCLLLVILLGYLQQDNDEPRRSPNEKTSWQKLVEPFCSWNKQLVLHRLSVYKNGSSQKKNNKPQHQGDNLFAAVYSVSLALWPVGQVINEPQHQDTGPLPQCLKMFEIPLTKPWCL